MKKTIWLLMMFIGLLVWNGKIISYAASYDGKDCITKVDLYKSNDEAFTDGDEIKENEYYKLEYRLDLNSISGLSKDDEITFQIPDGIKLMSLPLNIPIKANDSAETEMAVVEIDDSSISSGYYKGVITVKEMVDGDGQNWDKICDLWMTASLNKESIKDMIGKWDANTGEIDLKLSDDKTLSLKYHAEMTPSLLSSKEGEFDRWNDEGEAVFRWTITLKPENKEGYQGVYFKDIVLTDELGSGQRYVENSIIYKKNGAVTTPPSDILDDSEEGKLKINASKLSERSDELIEAKGSGADTYEIQYETVLDIELDSQMAASLQSGSAKRKAENTVTADYCYNKELSSDGYQDSKKEKKDASAEKVFHMDDFLQKSGNNGVDQITWSIYSMKKNLSG